MSDKKEIETVVCPEHGYRHPYRTSGPRINLGCLHEKRAYNHCGRRGCRNYINVCPLHSPNAGSSTATCNLTRASVLSGLSDEARETIDKAISLSPALEETILLIAELCFRDGENVIKEEWLNDEYR